MFFQKKQTKNQITTEQLNTLLKEKPKTIILDVRYQEELQYGQITKNQILIPLPDLQHRIKELEQFKNKKIIVYCRTGGRSGRAVDFLIKMGFNEPINLMGGILAWREFDKSVIPY